MVERSALAAVVAAILVITLLVCSNKQPSELRQTLRPLPHTSADPQLLRELRTELLELKRILAAQEELTRAQTTQLAQMSAEANAPTPGDSPALHSSALHSSALQSSALQSSGPLSSGSGGSGIRTPHRR